MAAIQTTPMLTVVTVLRDGRHILHQTDAIHGASGVLIGAHMALRGKHYGEEVARFVVIDRGNVTEHEPIR
jgi:hypothetical protein